MWSLPAKVDLVVRPFLLGLHVHFPVSATSLSGYVAAACTVNVVQGGLLRWKRFRWGFFSLSFAPAFAVWFDLATGFFDRRGGSAFSCVAPGLIYGVDADEVKPEVPQLVKEPVELGLVGDVPGQ